MNFNHGAEFCYYNYKTCANQIFWSLGTHQRRTNESAIQFEIRWNSQRPVEKLEKQIEENTANIVELTQKVNNSAEEFEQYKAKVEQLENSKSRLNNELNNVEQYSRRNNIRIFGIPELPDEDTNQIVQILREFARKSLEIDISESEFDQSHQVGTAKDDGKRLLLVKFTRHDVKEKVIKARRKLKGTKITITEDLTRINNQLLRVATEHDSVAQTWSWDGKNFGIPKDTNTVKVIHTLADLSKL